MPYVLVSLPGAKVNDLVPTVQWKQKELIVYLKNPRDLFWRSELIKHRHLEILYQSTVDIAKFYEEFKGRPELKWEFFATFDEQIFNVTRQYSKNKFREEQVRLPFMRIKQSFISYLIQSNIKLIPRVYRSDFTIASARLDVTEGRPLPLSMTLHRTKAKMHNGWFIVKQNRQLLQRYKKIELPNLRMIPDKEKKIAKFQGGYITLQKYWYYDSKAISHIVVEANFRIGRNTFKDLMPEFIELLKRCFNDISSLEETTTFDDYIDGWAKDLLRNSQFFETKLLNEQIVRRRLD